MKQIKKENLMIKAFLNLKVSMIQKCQKNKKIEANNTKFNLFNKREIEKVTKHLNNEMDAVIEEFYKTKKDKEKDDGLCL